MKASSLRRGFGSGSFLAVLAALLGSIFVSGVMAQEVQEALPLRYTAKFACGEGNGRVLSRGAYLTAINVNNATGQSIKLNKMFTIALPGEQFGGHTELSEDAVELPPYDSLEVDCDDILERARELCAAEFCKGFVVIESHAELEVVAVYTVADLNTDQVTTLHTARVPPRCPIRTDVVPAQTVLFVPPDAGGEDADPEFDSHGPCVDFRLSLEVEDGDKTLAAKYRMHAYECSDDVLVPEHDFTAAAGRDELVLKVASPQGRILGHDLLTGMEQLYIDTDHDVDPFTFDPPFPVEQLRFIGDTDGEEAGTKTGVFITFRQINVELETCAPAAPEGPIIE